MARVLVIGDIHEPASHPGYLPFIQHLADKWDTDRTVFIGDIIDFHCVSFHASEPDAAGPEHEASLTYERVQDWHAAFPKATVCVGNHDRRVYRLASSVKIPPRFIKDYASVWSTPGWNWVDEYTVDRVRYMHGTGVSGQQPALNAARKIMMSCCVGHTHGVAGVHWTAAPEQRRIFGMDTGCGVDVAHSSMRYGRELLSKPVLGAGVVIDGKQPYHEIMPCGRGEPFHRARFKR